MSQIDIKELLEAGVHFGHQTKRWNPKMKKYIFTARNGIYIIDLKKTFLSIQRAQAKLREIAEKGEKVIFVGTKKQAKMVIKEEATRCGQFYVTERWLGGTLTNFQTIKQNIKRLRNIEKMKEENLFESMTKKEGMMLEKERARLEKYLTGIKEMYKLPSALVVVDAKKERIAVAEANKLKIPVIAIIDTNTDPDPIDYPIAANDDAIKSISVIIRALADVMIEGATQMEKEISEKEAVEES
ncbi:MAG: 30S ribosomal protein S2 [candidate division Zixibacteria bacterium 4484_95]|nr:MAG: 30S ribosomal protein S2 [candidate division Zixibacteria bacterium 4484_95]